MFLLHTTICVGLIAAATEANNEKFIRHLKSNHKAAPNGTTGEKNTAVRDIVKKSLTRQKGRYIKKHF